MSAGSANGLAVIVYPHAAYSLKLRLEIYVCIPNFHTTDIKSVVFFLVSAGAVTITASPPAFHYTYHKMFRFYGPLNSM